MFIKLNFVNDYYTACIFLQVLVYKRNKVVVV